MRATGLALCAGWLAASTALSQDYNTLRYDEDWSFLRDETRRADLLDPLKYLPFDAAGDWYLTLGGEARLKYERYYEPALNQSPADRSGFLLQRYLLSADLHATESVRLFAQLQSSLENFREGGARPTDRDDLDLHQLFVDLAAHPDDTSLTLRLGRQEMAYGSQRLISVRESPNNRLAFDEARVLARFGNWRAMRWAAPAPNPRHQPTADVTLGGNAQARAAVLERSRAAFRLGRAEQRQLSVG